MYRGLDHLQLKDGRNSLVLNRDDAAGFRLDSTFTHKQHASISAVDEPELTTRSDYLNKYPSVLQVSSHMFMSTETTKEVSCGIVKAHAVFEKSPAKHAADLHMLEDTQEFKHIFQDKDIEYVRVDGCSDEAPSHEEVQFYWTERNVSRGNSCIVVITRHSGGLYLNRVELLNGCLAVAHSNLFLPSTLGGPCYTEKGLDKEQLLKNLDLATDVYINKVDGSPCAQQPIRLVKGANDAHAKYLRERRSKLLTFLKGKKEDRQQLQQKDPTVYKYFEEIWGVRKRHMVLSLPQHFVFMLLPCNTKDCPHPNCLPSAKKEDCTWFPHGPKLKYFPVPIPDPKRPWGGTCKQCTGICAGHYLRPEEHLDHYELHGTKGMIFKPPSVVIAEAHREAKKNKTTLSNQEIIALAKENLLKEEEVVMWLQHLSDVATRRKEGAKKAAVTRSKNKEAANSNSMEQKGKRHLFSMFEYMRN